MMQGEDKKMKKKCVMIGLRVKKKIGDVGGQSAGTEATASSS